MEKEKIIFENIKKIEDIWNDFVDKFSFINSIDKKFINNIQKVIDKMESLINKIRDIVIENKFDNKKIKSFDAIAAETNSKDNKVNNSKLIMRIKDNHDNS